MFHANGLILHLRRWLGCESCGNKLQCMSDVSSRRNSRNQKLTRSRFCVRFFFYTSVCVSNRFCPRTRNRRQLKMQNEVFYARYPHPPSPNHRVCVLIRRWSSRLITLNSHTRERLFLTPRVQSLPIDSPFLTLIP